MTTVFDLSTEGSGMTDTLHIPHTKHSTNELSTSHGPLPSGPVALRVPTRRLSAGKRLLDLAIAVPAAIASLPVVVALAAISSVRYRQWPFFTQPRLGEGGAEFQFWKIRTLPSIVPDTADKYQLQALNLPKFARVVRVRHLDELPQLWLVIAGKMTLVGPRPEMPTLSASFDQSFVADRLAVRPGCTGLWQVSRASRGLIGESPEWDEHYVRTATLRLDVWIMYRTWRLVSRLDEVTELREIPRWTGAALPPRS